MSDTDRLIEAMALDSEPPLARLLDRVHAFITRYVVLGVHEAVAVPLWVVHDWVLEAFDATGYLEIRSPVRQCGKSLLLDLLELVVPRPWKAIEPSEAVFYRQITRTTPTLLLDEVDAIFSRRAEATEGLRACLNAGNRRGTRVPRCVPPRMEVVEFEVFCAKALAGIGGLPATITDRSIPIEMRRKERGERVERFRRREAELLAAPLEEELERWAADAVPAVRLELRRVEHLANDGQPLESLNDRAWEQAWEPLLAVASLAGARWKALAIDAAAALSGNRNDEMDEGVVLLADIRGVFQENPDRDALATVELLDALLAIDTSPWRASWSETRTDEVKPSRAAPRKLSDALKPFGIRSGDIWMSGGGSLKGYRREHFRDAWARYLAHDPRDARGPREPTAHAASSLADRDQVSARDSSDPRGPRGDTASSSRSRGHRGHRGSEEPEDAIAWECPCGQEDATDWAVMSLREPVCDSCGRAYQPEYRISQWPTDGPST